MKYAKIAFEAVTIIFAAFGHFLFNISPPDETGQFAVGLSSFIAVCVFLFIVAIRSNQPRLKYKRNWLIVASVLFVLAIGSGLSYSSNYNKLVTRVPPETRIRELIIGTEWTEEGKAYREEHPEKTVAEILYDYGGESCIELVWKKESIVDAKNRLTRSYVLFVVMLSGTIFCLGEGILTAPMKVNPE
jgi:hypothetical protein